MNKIHKLKQAIIVNHAFDSVGRFMTCSKLERYGTAGLEMLIGKANEYGIIDQIEEIMYIDPTRKQRLLESYKHLVKSARYKIKSELIDNYMKLS
jgi:hypothetical protein